MEDGASAPRSEAVCLHAASDPTAEPSPYHAFSRAPSTEAFAKPSQWPGPEASSSSARLLWDEETLYVCYECEGRFAAPIKPEQCAPGLLSSPLFMGIQAGARANRTPRPDPRARHSAAQRARARGAVPPALGAALRARH